MIKIANIILVYQGFALVVFFFASLGMMIEWYDYSLYFLMAPYLQVLFFPTYSKSVSLFLFSLVYAITCVSRLIGGFILGSIADRFGRKRVFVSGAVLMTVSAMMMAVFPVHHVHGVGLLLSLIALRFAQGFSVGSEMSAALVIAFEHVSQKYKMTTVTVVMIFKSLGGLAASCVCLYVSCHYSRQHILDYAWRFPYYLAAIFGCMLYFLRTSISETPEFNQIGSSSERRPLALVLKHYGLIILLLAGVCLLSQALDSVYSIQNIYLPKYFHYHLHQIFWITMLSYLIEMLVTGGVLLLIVFFDIKFLLYLCFAVCVFIICPLYWLLPRGGYGLAILWTNLNSFVYLLGYLVSIKYLLTHVGAEIRTSAIALFTNLTIFSGFLFPVMLTYLLNKTNDPFIVPKSAWVIGVISLIFTVIFLRKVSGKSINSEHDLNVHIAPINQS